MCDAYFVAGIRSEQFTSQHASILVSSSHFKFRPELSPTCSQAVAPPFSPTCSSTAIANDHP